MCQHLFDTSSDRSVFRNAVNLESISKQFRMFYYVSNDDNFIYDKGIKRQNVLLSFFLSFFIAILLLIINFNYHIYLNIKLHFSFLPMLSVIFAELIRLKSAEEQTQENSLLCVKSFLQILRESSISRYFSLVVVA